MDELELFKKQWQKEEAHLPKLKFEEIYQMILKRSSSAMKWIFFICIFELGFGLIATIFYHPAAEKDFPVPQYLEWMAWIFYPIGVYFIYLFFKNFKRIETTSSVKELLKNIVRSRRTVRLYIIISLAQAGIYSFIMLLITLINWRGGWSAFSASAGPGDYLLLIGASLVVTLFIVGIFLLLYLFLYGILMGRLKRNYNELKKMDQ